MVDDSWTNHVAPLAKSATTSTLPLGGAGWKRLVSKWSVSKWVKEINFWQDLCSAYPHLVHFFNARWVRDDEWAHNIS